MTDIERIKKLNKMIPEMKKYGFAETFDDAAKKTEEIFAEKFLGNEPVREQAKVQEPKERSDRFDRFRQIVEDRLKNIECNVSNVFSKINDMVRAINEIEKKLLEPKQIKEETPEPTVQSKIVEPQQRSSKEDPNPKNGDFTPENIDIREYFNFSKRV